MNKPLTIEQLKALEVGDWVWVVDPTKEDFAAYIQKDTKSKDKFNQLSWELFYSGHGKTWLAYKNKEQAEAKGEIVELPCKIGDEFYGFPNKIDAPNQYFKYTVKGIEYRQDGVYLRTTYDINFKYRYEAFMTEPKSK